MGQTAFLLACSKYQYILGNVKFCIKSSLIWLSVVRSCSDLLHGVIHLLLMQYPAERLYHLKTTFPTSAIVDVQGSKYQLMFRMQRKMLIISKFMVTWSVSGKLC